MGHIEFAWLDRPYKSCNADMALPRTRGVILNVTSIEEVSHA